ncbi:fumarylacetoacetate hydrolase family protein [Enteractinococcus helveticum]|uniref:2-keto-4-pentenoate hydratase n=1 Tax=Enteractinococcus helveticum TaxID=1837282 RepID=A0A1B7LV72_9MICC|nr:fumarylacetoacetate hydrolase family protein [Enteractinococcus helveticum]OAV52027.1 2-keto-4-pentenoate hydratase [Enteractinococcus helveticum]
MKLATLNQNGSTITARLDGDTDDGTYTEISGYTNVGKLLKDPAWRSIAEAADGTQHHVLDAQLATIVPNPSKIFCIGLNYTEHIQEMGRELPEYPTVFAKFADTLTGPRDDVVAIAEDQELDWEGELVAIIGKTAYKVSEEEAADYIAGFSIANDISMRGWQARTQEWLQGKVWANSTPVGPVLVTADEFDSDSAVLKTKVNEKVMQEHPISDLLFNPAQLVSYLSTIVPLRPGDMILTGTPGGVGKGHNPPIFLESGDFVEVAVDGIGQLKNNIVEPHEVARAL